MRSHIEAYFRRGARVRFWPATAGQAFLTARQVDGLGNSYPSWRSCRIESNTTSCSEWA